MTAPHLPASAYTATSLFSLKGQIALVTGGGTGIGLMIAHGLAANGAKVYVSGRRLEVLEKVSGKWGDEGGEIVPIQMDVTSKDSILSVVSSLEKSEGKLNILVNNAGQAGPRDPFVPSRDEYTTGASFGTALFNSSAVTDWSSHFESNVASIFFVSTAFFGLLTKGAESAGDVKGSSIVNITSISGIMKLAQDHFCYNAAKASASHLTKLLSTELALRKIPIRVNAIAPGPFASEMTGNEPVIGKKAADGVSKPLVSLPAERGGLETEMAAAALYLVSAAGAYTNGQEIVVDGGFLAVNPSTK